MAGIPQRRRPPSGSAMSGLRRHQPAAVRNYRTSADGLANRRVRLQAEAPVYERICSVRRKADLVDRLAASYRRPRARSRAPTRAPRAEFCALAIAGISCVGEKPSSAGVRTACASTRWSIDRAWRAQATRAARSSGHPVASRQRGKFESLLGQRAVGGIALQQDIAAQSMQGGIVEPIPVFMTYRQSFVD